MRAVRVHSLSAGFRSTDKPTLTDLSIDIEAGSVYGIVGPSGCGKSTLLRVLAGLHAEWSGAVELLGEPIVPRRRFPAGLRRSVQMVFQDPYACLHPFHTIGRTLLEPLQLLGVDNPRARRDQALEQVGLPAAISRRYPHQLSGGERQRVAISRALLPRPKILLLDEPTSALDLATQAEILNLLQQLQAQESMTFVLVSHDRAVIAHLCDEAAVMADGRIAGHLDRSALDEVGA